MNPRLNVQHELKTLSELANRQIEKKYAWLRWFILLSAGFFSLMAGQLSGKVFPPSQLVLLKWALELNALGILSGSIALYAEVSVARSLTQGYRERLKNMLEEKNECATIAPIVASPSIFLIASEWLSYLSSTGSLFAWMAFIFIL